MSKAFRTALLPLLGVLLFSSPSLAGPGGNRNGDPDRPQGSNPTFVESFVSLQVNPGGPAPSDRAELLIPDARGFLLRIYLHWIGLILR